MERRVSAEEQSSLWDKLSLAQKFAASSLTQFGYDLAYIREQQGGSTAVLLCDNNAATISSDGEINTAPSIQLR
ncbi:hypothetical protein ACPUVO_02195 [Pseudocolwellia sp. HL-MZ19]|uniref:hypothetical protein n=1 Tax=unclassified Pseudocolwellia TaxID=2848178 RepID=UPI003CF21B92